MFLIKPYHHEAKQNIQNAPSPTAELHIEQAIHFALSVKVQNYNNIKVMQGICISLFKKDCNILNTEL
jgi:hypothetical protein